MKLTISQAVRIYAALQSLDQYTKVFKNADGVETPVSVPFNWTPDTRWAIFGNIRILAPIDEDFKKLSDAEVKQRSGGKPSLKQSDDPALFQELVDNVNKIAGKEVEVQLAELPEAEFKNQPVPFSVLAALAPILRGAEGRYTVAK
jgi:hypothetical protein